MKRSVVLCLTVLGLSLPTLAQRAKVPTFAGYPAKVERATARSIDFQHSPGAWSFRTRLREALRDGVNFAGRYIVAGWGCGTGCISGAIIDARSGRVYFPEALAALGAGTTDDGGYVEEPVRYKKNSRLFIISGIPGSPTERTPELPAGDYYYEWRNNRLRLIRSVPFRKTHDVN